MTVPGNIDALLLGGQRGYQIERSLRFNSADSAYLSKTPTTPTNNLKWTFSCWVKRSALGANSALFDAYLNGVNFSTFYFTSTNELQFYNILGGVDTGVTTTGIYRDLSAWYHIVFVFDSANATAADRAIIYVNGTRPAQTNPYGAVTSSEGTYLNNSYAHSIGRMVDSGTYLNGYLTETYLIDGQALTPSSFGETDTITGVWKPKKYSGSGYGTNGFYLNFKDNSSVAASTLGKDYSGNGNNWTPNNFSVTAGAGNDSLIDTPTPYADGGNGRGNYCTLNAVNRGLDATLSNGNLDISYGSSSSVTGTPGTIGVSAGKWYWEVTPTGGTGSNAVLGIVNTTANSSVSSGIGYYVGYTANGWGYEGVGGTKRNAGSTSYGATFTTNDVIGVAFDADNGTLTFYKNGVSQGQAFSGLTSGPYFPAVSDGSEASTLSMTCNFGQRAFAYTPPSGFKALNTQNLPEPSIKKPSSYFDAKLYTGTGGSQSITGLGFSPDLVWIKSRSLAYAHNLGDTVRGVNNTLSSNSTGAENYAGSGDITAFNSDGFSIRQTSNWEISTNGATYVAWCWDESATPGFDIVLDTGTGVAKTVAHSLGVAPNFMIRKNRTSGTGHWYVYHSSVGAAQAGILQLANAFASSTAWNSTTPTSSVFSVGANADENLNGGSFLTYLWSEVAGFSKFGSYTGNGSTDGPFVFTGMRPAYLLIKVTSTANGWLVYDKARNPNNAADAQLYPHLSNAESTDTTYHIDFLSNGFKIRNTNAVDNSSGATYIFAAFAESPFKYSLAR